jgi:hypothetical protein
MGASGICGGDAIMPLVALFFATSGAIILKIAETL